MKKQEIRKLKEEIRWRKELIKRLEYPQNQLKNAAEKEKQCAEQKAIRHNALLQEYPTYEAAHDAYGYDEITEDEFRAIEDALEGKEFAVSELRTASVCALEELSEFIMRHKRAISSFEFDMLPDTEKERIRQESAERQERARARKEELQGAAFGGGKSCMIK